MPKRFWLFAFDDFYPSGGLDDRVGMYNTVAEAKTVGRVSGRNNWSVYDLWQDETVYGEWDEPEPVNLVKPSSADNQPLYMSLPTMTAPRGAVEYLGRGPR